MIWLYKSHRERATVFDFKRQYLLSPQPAYQFECSLEKQDHNILYGLTWQGTQGPDLNKLPLQIGAAWGTTDSKGTLGGAGAPVLPVPLSGQNNCAGGTDSEQPVPKLLNDLAFTFIPTSWLAWRMRRVSTQYQDIAFPTYTRELVPKLLMERHSRRHS